MGTQIVLHPLQAAWLVLKCAVELGFERGIEGFFETGAGLKTELDEVAAENDGLGRGVLESELLGAGAEKTEALFCFYRDERRAAEMIWRTVSRSEPFGLSSR